VNSNSRFLWFWPEIGRFLPVSFCLSPPLSRSLAELHEARVNSATHVETSAQRMRSEVGLWRIKLFLLNALSQNEILFHRYGGNAVPTATHEEFMAMTGGAFGLCAS
jgi:hypothetical protein